jgi:hypothetical protein
MLVHSMRCILVGIIYCYVSLSLSLALTENFSLSFHRSVSYELITNVSSCHCVVLLLLPAMINEFFKYTQREKQHVVLSRS